MCRWFDSNRALGSSCCQLLAAFVGLKLLVEKERVVEARVAVLRMEIISKSDAYKVVGYSLGEKKVVHATRVVMQTGKIAVH